MWEVLNGIAGWAGLALAIVALPFVYTRLQWLRRRLLNWRDGPYEYDPVLAFEWADEQRTRVKIINPQPRKLRAVRAVYNVTMAGPEREPHDLAPGGSFLLQIPQGADDSDYVNVSWEARGRRKAKGWPGYLRLRKATWHDSVQLFMITDDADRALDAREFVRESMRWHTGGWSEQVERDLFLESYKRASPPLAND